MMDADELEARHDPNLEFQAYYARLNALNSILSPLSINLLKLAWEGAATQPMQELRRSTTVGMLVADLIRALDLKEITRYPMKTGEWFTHSGVTRYRSLGKGLKEAEIDLPGNRRLVSTVRDECQITRSAEGNMSGEDDISLVVGRVLSGTKFDLVVAGYRTPPFMVAAASGARIFDPSSVPGNVLDLLNHAPHLKVPQTSFLGISEEDTLSSAIGDTLYRFKEAVEHQGAWKNLYDDSKGDPAPETRHQSLFRLFGTLSFEMFGIQVMPNADHGSGQTDLTLALGDAVQVVEFKKDHDQARLVHGLTKQLPKYMRAARTTIGWYFIMCHDRDPEEVRGFLDQFWNQIETEMELKIGLIAVDCRRQQSASKL
jgi:hypothetical protein